MHKEDRGGVARACAWGTKHEMHLGATGGLERPTLMAVDGRGAMLTRARMNDSHLLAAVFGSA